QLLTPGASLFAAAATALVAFLAIVLPLRSQRVQEMQQRQDAANKDREQREDVAQKDRDQRAQAAEKDRQERQLAAARDLAQREKDLTARFDLGFAAAVAALGDESLVVQAGGAAALQSYLRDDLAVFVDQVYLVVRANL